MIVLDTNVISELMRPEPHEAVRTWLLDHVHDGLCTTSVTVAEIRFGLERLDTGRRRLRLQQTADEIFTMFEDQILSFDSRAAARYASIAGRRERLGRPIDGFDAQIAAISATNEAILATRNMKDFLETGIVVVDPWDA